MCLLKTSHSFFSPKLFFLFGGSVLSSYWMHTPPYTLNYYYLNAQSKQVFQKSSPTLSVFFHNYVQNSELHGQRSKSTNNLKIKLHLRCISSFHSWPDCEVVTDWSYQHQSQRLQAFPQLCKHLSLLLLCSDVCKT